MRSGFFVLVLLISWSAFSQDAGIEITEIPTKDSIRSLYISRFPNYFFLYPVLKQRGLSFELEKRDRSDLLTFRPNNSFSLGLGAYLFEVCAELTVAIPIDEKKTAIYGKSDARDIQLNLLARSFGIDVYYQKYKGFYLTGKGEEPEPGDPYPQRGDIASRNIGLTGTYIFNKKFSYRSAYNFSERQLASRGSIILTTNISRFTLGADSSILDAAQELSFGSKVGFKKLRYSTFSLAPGYSYTMIYKSFFLNGTLSVGPAHHWIHHELEHSSGKDETAINSFVAARISIGYNGDRIFGGIVFVTQGSNVKFEDVTFSNNNETFKILMGYRFREFGWLKKRAIDAVPFKI